LKPNERASFREFNKSPFIKSPIKENISTFTHKVSLIIQIHLGGVDLPMDKEFSIIKRQFQSEKSIIFERVLRLIRCVVECKAYECDAIATCNTLELLRSIAAGYWENSTLQLRQLPAIGPAAVRKLVQSNVKTVEQLAAMDPAAIERVMSRNPPFGMKILGFVMNFPRLTLLAEIKKTIRIGDPVKVQVKAQLGYSNAKFPAWNRKTPTVTFTASLSKGRLAYIWRGSLKRLEKGFDITFTCELSYFTDIIDCQLACEEIIGTIQSVKLKPEIPASAFPPLKPILSPAKTAPNFVRAKATIVAEEEEVEIVAAFEAEEDIGNAASGSDYGGDSVFDDFVDIDVLERGTTGLNGELEAAISEPLRMENGKWRCNHKCRDAQGNYLTKNGKPCKHLCCREGLEKPRKIQKKKVR
jgi:ATP-dependent DNA helicase HFM1/MER3